MSTSASDQLLHDVYSKKTPRLLFVVLQGLTYPLRRLTDVCLPPLPFVAAVIMKMFVLVLCALVAIAYALTDAEVKEAAQAYVDKMFGKYTISQINYYKFGEEYKIDITLNMVCMFKH